MSGTTLKLESVSIFIQDNKLLNNVSLEICPHDFLFLTGNNGCGKSTLMNVIANYQPLSVPMYKIKGQIIYKADEKHPDYDLLAKSNCQWYLRQIYYLKQNSELRGTIFQLFERVMNTINITVSREDVENIFRQYDVFVERLDGNKKWFQKSFLDQSIDSLSGGQKKVVEILAALMRAKILGIKILLIDEPFNHLDVKNIKKVVELILEVRNINPDLAIIVATHCMAFPSPCLGNNLSKYQIEKDYFKHYIVTNGIIRPALENEEYKQGSCFIDAL